MKQTNLMSLFSWTITHISWMTMAFSPVALGREAENFQIQKLKNDIQELGLNKKTTVADFWNKSKFYIPGFAYAGFEKYSKLNSTKLMPTFEVKSTKNSLGEEVPTIQINDNGKTTTVQLIGEPDKYVKVNNQYFTEKEVQNPKVFFAKLVKSDAKLKTDLNKSVTQNNYQLLDEKTRPFKNFTGLPRLNKQLWAAMTVQQKAAYIVEMRLLNEKASLVKEAYSLKQKTKKTSSFEYLKKYQAAWELLVGETANALPNFTGQHCINQGFVAEDVSAYNKNSFNYRTNKKGAPLQVEACNLQTILDSSKYKTASTQNKLVQKAREVCQSSGKMPCNPIVYSFKSDGSPYCSDAQSEQSYQAGTHFKGSCDSQSRLSSGFVDASNLGLRSEADQGKGNNEGKDLSKLNKDELRKLIEQSQAKESFAATENYLSGMLKGQGRDDLQVLLAGKQWSEDLEKEILSIQKAFEQNIKESMSLCSTSLKDSAQKNESNYRDACEQLHRRWLFSEKIIAQLKCADDTLPIKDPTTGKKACATPPVPVVIVDPPKPVACPAGSSPYKDQAKETEGQCLCDGSTTMTFPAGPLPEACLKKPDVDISNVKCNDVPAMLSSGQCVCDNGQPPQVKEPGFFSKIFHTDDDKKSQATEYECDSGINWWLVGGIAAGIGLLALLFKHKEKNTKCSNGGNPPDCIVNSACPAGSTGTPPDKCFANGQCPTGTTGTFPNCYGAGQCPAGSTGTFPNCLGTGKCPTGTTGTFPNCIGTGQCPAGTTGSFPNCYGSVTCQGNQQLINGACRCASSCSVSGATQNPVSCVCTAPPSEGGTGSPTCQRPPCSGGVPTAQ